MSSSPPLAEQGESDANDDTGPGDWEDEDEEGDERDSERYMDEQSALGMDENAIAGWEEESSFYPQSPQDLHRQQAISFGKKPYSPQDLSGAEEERSFDLSDPGDSELLLFTESRGGYIAGGYPDDATQGHDGILEDSTASPYWQPVRDRQLDITEDEQERGSSADLERRKVYDEMGSGEERGPYLLYDGHYESDYSLSPEAIQDSQALYKEYRKTLDFETDGDEELWEPSGTRSGEPKALADVSNESDMGSENNLRPFKTSTESFNELDEGSSNTSASAFGSLSQLGDTMAFPSVLPAALEKQEPNPLTDSSKWNLTESLKNHLSMEDLQEKPGIDAETFPEISFADSVEESNADVPRMSIRRASLSLSQLSASKPLKKREGSVRGPPSPSPQQVGTSYLHQVQKLKKTIPAVLPSKHIRQSRSLSPKWNLAQSSSPKLTLCRTSTEPMKYGQGQLNYPLPDFSKVEPRVKFPRESYQPPRARSRSIRPSSSENPLIFKSPAEIVREVLLSSGEGFPQKLDSSGARIPDEFKSPQQATELVHQLQEDYHKLLTKYAEAENTIDQLRLGAKVNLYADPPKPSQSLQMGAVSQGSRVMAFTIPQARTAEFSQTPSQMRRTSLDPGLRLALGEDSASIPSNSQGEDFLAAGRRGSTDGQSPGDFLTNTLVEQAEKFQRQVESFERLIQMKKLTPLDQLKGFQRLTEAQDALERAYLQAREENRHLQQHPGTAEPPEEFDPDRLVEGEIFRLGMQLEELKEGIDLAIQSQFPERVSPEPMPSRMLEVTLVSDAMAWPPTPLPPTPIPALRTPYPENADLKESFLQDQVDMEVSSESSKGEDSEGLPRPLRHKQLRMEKEFDNLLDQYNNFKTLPDAVDLGKGQEDRGNQQKACHFAGDPWMSRRSSRQPSLREERSRRAPQPQPMERKPSPLGESQETVLKNSHPPSLEGKELFPQSSATNARALTVNPKSSSQSPQRRVSHQSSMAGSPVSQSLHHKAFPQAKMLHSEERIVSPETDSGFVGSESSRLSPLSQTPEHRNSHARIPSLADRLVKTSTNSPRQTFPRQGIQPGDSAKEPVKTSVAVRSTHPRASAQRPSVTRDTTLVSNPCQKSSPSHWTNSIAGSEMGQHAYSTHTDSEEEAESGTSICEPLPDSRRSRSTSWTPSPSPPQRRIGIRADVLCSRSARDQAIQALQTEVSRLQRRLEDSLYRSQSDLAETSGTMGQPAGESLSPGCSTPFRKSTEAGPEKMRQPAHTIKLEEQGQLPMLPPNGPELNLDLSSESDRSLLRPQDRKYRKAWSMEQHPQRLHDTFIFRGPYTGTEYQMQAPGSLSPGEDLDPISCSHCQGTGTQPPVIRSVSMGDLRRSAQHSTPKRASCPLCRGSKTDATRTTSEKPARAPDEETDSTSPQISRSNQKAEKEQQEQQQQCGFWFMPGAPIATTPMSYIPTVPLVPYSSHIVYSPAPASTSPPLASSHRYYTSGYQVTELHPRAARQHRQSVMLGAEDLEELSWSLSQALEAAKGVRRTTKKISHSLTSDLSYSRSLRGSCLF
ncbi:microtubule organization protein AKNA [Rhinatrema bivittatum]|uniref:microtubule organization protein AKNA n=1 Tax=Rhinatrema bivittatum TaxID=194408 RepID=UPI00112CFB0B|nr:microtubule organization protein AKNA [Rhinatrema bivittatum]XP_029467234.1 microtubule organization protein AKNA [Rhinatrema bivittatum]